VLSIPSIHLKKEGNDMRVKLLGLMGAGILCATTLFSPLNALAQKKGQDYPDEKCTRINKDESTTNGPCSDVCKDLEVTGRDVDTGLRKCKEGSTMFLSQSPMQLMRYDDGVAVKVSSLTPKGYVMGVHPLPARQ
jgi:hypothetical protein